MIRKILSSAQRQNLKSEIPILLGLPAIILFFVGSGFVSYWNIRILSRNTAQIMHTHEVILSLDNLLSAMKDAETGQRGFLITGDEKYLTPYDTALANIDDRIGDLTNLTRDNDVQQTRIALMKAHAHAKFTELAETIALRRNQGFDAARAVVVTDRGKNEMDMLRAQINATRQEEEYTRAKRMEEMQAAYRLSISSTIIASLLGVLISLIIGSILRRAAALRRRQAYLQAGEIGLTSALLGDQRTEQLGTSALKFFAEYFDAHVGAFFVKDGSGYRRVATYGVPADEKIQKSFNAGDGLLGQAVQDSRAFIIREVPDGYLTVGSALGHGKPRHLLIAPAMTDGIVNAVIELGFINNLNDWAIELFNQVSEAIGIAVRSANYRANLQDFLEETQRQSEELQAQGEELRVSNEELEEQSRALKESQIRLEQQQAELEQTNTQLEEQTQMLEGQKDDLERTRATIQLKAQELEQASQYKSDFLANMSHELRTPLNSSLILAKLLADNPAGNLSEEQVKFAQTIQSSGNDLLSLINDILDLSKIEAGHMELRPETVPLARMLKDLTRVFEPLAGQKGLRLQTQILPGCPETIETDRQRLEQVLKNLLSNAIKFTDTGSVELNISPGSDQSVIFTVKDTGIGIAPEQQQAIFDAFRQADGTISRRYGGTGLGLSISRELTRLLGGSIKLDSTVGQGSSFAMTLPAVYDPGLVVNAQRISVSMPGIPAANADKPETIREKVAPPPTRHIRHLQDDREKLNKGDRTILVVEDDESFAKILYDLSHELGFQCLLAATAEDALIMARQYLPNAVVLDIGLPDNSGLSVLDRLKRDTRTRHIPVHVVSGDDHAQTAMALGAVGYMLKPVKRDALIDTLQKLEMKFSQRMRRVLIVEDDPVQRHSVGMLLGSHDVEAVEVGTAAECLERLREATFDCMVLDLSLPDASGYTLLETLSREDAYSFPPVIVYTGRDLSADDEQRLRRYSKSIIIKGAKSPERLLDEVTLFLHQVVSDLPPEQQRMLEKAKSRDAALENKRILIVEDDVANIYALTSILEPRGAVIRIARNGREALELLEKSSADPSTSIDLVLMDMMMPEMDGLTATRAIRKRPEWKKLPVIMLTAKAMRDDQERCLEAGANDYMAKPLDVEKLLSLVRVWMPR